MTSRRLRLSLLVFAWLCCSASHAEIVIAQVAPRTGPLGPNGVANYGGAKALIDDVNAKGGINGQRLRLVFEDDQYQPEETIRLLQQVAARDKPLLFINLLGSANVSAVLKDGTLERLGIAAVGITPGSEALRSPGSAWMFHVQAGDKLQLQRIVGHLSTIGVSSVGVVYQDIPFGQSGLRFVEELAGRAGIRVVGRSPVKPGSDELREAAAQLKQSGAQTYVMVLAPNSGAAFVRDVRATQDKTPIYGMSYVSVREVVAKAGGPQADGVALAQITPNTFSDGTSLVREFKRVMQRFGPDGGAAPDQLQLMGYIAARAAVEALRAAGPSPTPAKVQAALKTLKFDDGGFPIDFSHGNVGSAYVNIGVISRNGRLVY